MHLHDDAASRRKSFGQLKVDPLLSGLRFSSVFRSDFEDILVYVLYSVAAKPQCFFSITWHLKTLENNNGTTK